MIFQKRKLIWNIFRIIFFHKTNFVLPFTLNVKCNWKELDLYFMENTQFMLGKYRYIDVKIIFKFFMKTTFFLILNFGEAHETSEMFVSHDFPSNGWNSIFQFDELIFWEPLYVHYKELFPAQNNILLLCLLQVEIP